MKLFLNHQEGAWYWTNIDINVRINELPKEDSTTGEMERWRIGPFSTHRKRKEDKTIRTVCARQEEIELATEEPGPIELL